MNDTICLKSPQADAFLNSEEERRNLLRTPSGMMMHRGSSLHSKDTGRLFSHFSFLISLFFVLISQFSFIAATARNNYVEYATEPFTIVNEALQLVSPEAPALMPFFSTVSLSQAGGGYLYQDLDVRQNPQLGNGENLFHVGASSFTRTKDGALWGHARYENGNRRNVMYCETSDLPIVYPYVAADTVGGSLKLERYSLEGGYAGSGGAWLWGATLSYDAGLYFSDIDPRPRNVTGNLTARISGGRRIADSHVTAISLDLQRYTQSNDIDFKSETGAPTVYHLTGLGHHYRRFASQGQESKFSGYGYGVRADLLPANGQGVALTVAAGTLSIDKTLTELNSLTMADISHRTLKASVGWITGRCAVAAGIDTYRRHGTEHFFGDATSNIYPEIGKALMYADNHYRLLATAAGSARLSNLTLNGLLSGGYDHRREVYVEPYTARLTHSPFVNSQAGADYHSGRCFWQFTLSYGYDLLSRNRAGASLSLTVSIRDRHSLSLAARYHTSRFGSETLANLAWIF